MYNKNEIIIKQQGHNYFVLFLIFLCFIDSAESILQSIVCLISYFFSHAQASRHFAA